MLRAEWTDANGDPAVVETTWNGTETEAELVARHIQALNDKIDSVGVQLTPD